MSIKEMMLKQKGIWLITLNDKSKWVVDLDNMMFDNYKWFKIMETTENELTYLDDLIHEASKVERLK